MNLFVRLLMNLQLKYYTVSLFSYLLCLSLLSFLCTGCDRGGVSHGNVDGIDVSHYNWKLQRSDVDGLIVLCPQYSKIELVCGTMPSKEDESVLLVVEAAYTGDTLNEFKHENIAGGHVSGGKRYKGYKCKNNSGAFVYYNDSWKFLYDDYSSELDKAAANGGCGFAQEIIIHNGKIMETKRKDFGRNQYRALCEHDGKLCVIESKNIISFGDFKQKLKTLGVKHAIYLDMGAGWNYAWYRDGKKVIELNPIGSNSKYCTNWITFFK